MELINIAKEIEGMKEVAIDILKDTLNDYKKDGIKKNITIWILIIALVASFITGQYLSYKANIEYQENIKQLAEENDQRFKEFLSQYDFETTYEQTLDVNNNSYISDTFKINQK